MARFWPRAASCSQYFREEESVQVTMPPIEEQERLLRLYFTYVHPEFPVVHKALFLAQFNARYPFHTTVHFAAFLLQFWMYSKLRSVLLSQIGMTDRYDRADPCNIFFSFSKPESPRDDVSWSSTPTPPTADPAHQVPRVLLLAMFAIAARYTTTNVEPLPPKGQMWEGGCSYVNDARALLSMFCSSFF
jgi:hypothetical protein